MELSPKGKIPWLTLNDEDVSDSDFCIKYLQEKYQKNLSEHLSEQEKAIARSFLKLTEESLRWYLFTYSFNFQ
jgi:glutathione S-transferase